MSLKIVFMGTPEFSVPALEGLIQNKFNVIKVYTQPPRKSKRGQKINNSPIAETSIKNKICLLYTSPSPRDGLLSRMPSSA